MVATRCSQKHASQAALAPSSSPFTGMELPVVCCFSQLPCLKGEKTGHGSLSFFTSFRASHICLGRWALFRYCFLVVVYLVLLGFAMLDNSVRLQKCVKKPGLIPGSFKPNLDIGP